MRRWEGGEGMEVIDALFQVSLQAITPVLCAAIGTFTGRRAGFKQEMQKEPEFADVIWQTYKRGNKTLFILFGVVFGILLLLCLPKLVCLLLQTK